MNSLKPSYVVTFDVGGSHVSAGLCRLADLKIVRVKSAPLADTFEGFADLLQELATQTAGGEADLAGASLAVPGPFDLKAGVSLMEHKLKPLYGKDLRGALAKRFGWKPEQIRFLNDASAYLLGEVGAGAVCGAKRAAGLTLGTGVGSGFAVNGRCVEEGEGVPPGGEIWNFPYAGGIVEDLISTRRLKADYLARTGTEKEVSAIAAEAGKNSDARAVFEAFGLHLGEVLRDVIAPFRPDMVMIGGGISRSAQLFLPVTEKQITGLGFRVVTSTLLDQAPLVGAGQFWREEASGQSASEALARSSM